jgi:hypothetical protein
MIISRITPTGPGTHTPQSAARQEATDPPVASRAVVPVERVAPTVTRRSARPDASFVAHLIAMAEQTPQTRSLRRATPSDARMVYDRATVRSTNNSGRMLSQTA